MSDVIVQPTSVESSLFQVFADSHWVAEASLAELVTASDALWNQALAIAISVRASIQDMRPTSATAESSFYTIEQSLHQITQAERDIRDGADPRGHAEKIVAATTVINEQWQHWTTGVFILPT